MPSTAPGPLSAPEDVKPHSCAHCGLEYDPRAMGRGWRYCNALCRGAAHEARTYGEKHNYTPAQPTGRPGRYPLAPDYWNDLIPAELRRRLPDTFAIKHSRLENCESLLLISSIHGRARLSIGNSWETVHQRTHVVAFYLDCGHNADLYLTPACVKRRNERGLVYPFTPNKNQRIPFKRIACFDPASCISCRHTAILQAELNIEPIELVHGVG